MTLHTIHAGFCVGLSLVIGIATGALVKYPVDRNATIGQKVILYCKTDLEYTVFWYFNGHEIFYGGKVAMSFQSMFNVTSAEKGEYNLVISSANASYNGEYTCGDDEGQGQKKTAWLHVTAAPATEATTTNVGNTIIITGVLVCFVLIGLAIIIVYCWWKRKRNGSETEQEPFSGENGKPPTASAKIAEQQKRLHGSGGASSEEIKQQKGRADVARPARSEVDTTNTAPVGHTIDQYKVRIGEEKKNNAPWPKNRPTAIVGAGKQGVETAGQSEKRPLLGTGEEIAELKELSDSTNLTRNVHDEEPCRGGNVTAPNEDSLPVVDADHRPTASYAVDAELNASSATPADTKAATEGSRVVVKDDVSSATVTDENEPGKNTLNESKVENQDTREDLSATGSPGGGSGVQGAKSSTPSSSVSKEKDKPLLTVSPIQTGDESKHQGGKPIPAPKPGKPMT